MHVEHNGYKINFVGARVGSESIETSIPDSFVRGNKLDWFTGNGEARLYVGSIDSAPSFFGSDFVHNDIYVKAFVTQNDLMSYLESASAEYQDPQNVYRRQDTMPERFARYKNEVSELDDIEYFYISRHMGKKDTQRFFIHGYDDTDGSKNDAHVWTLMREILLPQISTMFIGKVLPDDEDNPIYWFRPYLSSYTRLKHPKVVDAAKESIEEDESLTDQKKYSLVSSRVGQGEFRQKCMKRYNSTCLLTRLDQFNIIEACHIKPWIDSSNSERLDVRNSIALTPTMHRLFDLGFIGFDEDCRLILSNYLTTATQMYLEGLEGQSFERELGASAEYLLYHRENCFRD